MGDSRLNRKNVLTKKSTLKRSRETENSSTEIQTKKARLEVESTSCKRGSVLTHSLSKNENLNEVFKKLNGCALRNTDFL